MGFINVDRKQGDLLGYTVDDFVPANAKCRQIVAIVAKMDLKALYDRYSAAGADAFDPATILATWFYAYVEGTTSTRDLEKKCRRDLHFIYTSGNLHPDHSSLSRFRKDHSDLLPRYFERIVAAGQEAGYPDFKDIVEARSWARIKGASPDSEPNSSDLEHVDALRKDIADYLTHCQAAEDESGDADLASIRKRIQELGEWEEALKQSHAELRQQKKHLKSVYRHQHFKSLLPHRMRFW